MSKWQFTKGLHDIGNDVFAYIQPDGGWGWSNSGLIVDQEDSLLVDTLFTPSLTQEMLEQMCDATPAAKNIGVLVNTHANADHTWGNQLIKDAKIIASTGCAEEFDHFLPEQIISMLENSADLGLVGEFAEHCFSSFNFNGIELTPPTSTFEKEMSLLVGDKKVELFNVGPAHTRGDVLVFVPSDRVVFTGDIIFNGGHPVIWDGPIRNWQKACDIILSLEADVIVPGHGPITDKTFVNVFKGYLDYIESETKKRYEAGLSVWDAACDISLADYDTWIDAERIYGNVAALYREFEGDESSPMIMQIFEGMARYHKEITLAER
ncbi:MAG: MBL fold metallo-hydrolase [Alphaproteobacteria bacterium]|jgi:cyclase|nr:MBL fold metallo-hydrolase [Alphaproteobacteria bacterium]PPR13427.1 MAG: hypothetical protein CFH42_01179 [Alphaproteobacteria bacterium MarineAlpha12_Bin1]|tara:strand:- start:366 stop:1331 length:966 start_codon:yes stop_codon:yes gene_type:complete